MKKRPEQGGRKAGGAEPLDPAAVTVYWRPGCLWCALLRRRLRRAGVATTELNIWEDADAAATVRRVAGGNETVPTVFVGDVPLVGPSASEVRRVLGEVTAAAEG